MNTEYAKYRNNLIIGICIVAVLGTISHFVYDWTGQNSFLGFFFPINESTWEHMKLAFFPMLFISPFMYDKSEPTSGYNHALLVGTMTATWLIPALYYTYKGILGFSKSWLDISTYYIPLLLSAILMLHIAKTAGTRKYCKKFYLLIAIVVFQAIAFWIFTYHPLHLGICK